jgi:hypothetical protein
MDIAEFKEQLIGLYDDVGIPGMYQDDTRWRTWQELAESLKWDAGRYHKFACRVAGYAGVASRKAKTEVDGQG